MKQVPLLFVLMSRRRKRDYVAVFQKIRSLLPDLAVEGFVMDFERATWSAVEDVFLDARVQGGTGSDEEGGKSWPQDNIRGTTGGSSADPEIACPAISSTRPHQGSI